MRSDPALSRNIPDVASPLWRRRWFQNLLLALVALGAAYALMVRDVVARSKEAYEQAEMHMGWTTDPAAKRVFFDARFASAKDILDADLEAKRLSSSDYRRELDTLEFDRDFALRESSLKYAYQWYKDASEVFSPPESKWVRLSRQKAPRALDLWKQELRAQNVPFDESMFE